MKKLYPLLFVLSLLLSFTSQAQKQIQEDQKYVVIEELTGTWCSYCPRGTYEGRQLSQDYDNVIFVAIHTNDVMEIPDYASASGLTGAPSANINRKHLGLDTQVWESKVNQETAIDPPAYITVETNYNETTREIEAIVSAEFIEDYSGNIRLAALVMEDGVTGPSPDFDQSNHYSGGANGPMGGFEDLPSSIPANMIAYDHLARELLGGYDGVDGSIPTSVNSGETYTHTFTYTLPEDHNHEYIRIAAWLLNDDNGHILNAGKSSYLPGFDNAKPHFISEPITSGNVGIQYNYQFYTADPETDDLVISATVIPDWMSFEETAQHSVHTAGLLSGVPTETGVFPITITVNDGEWTTEQNYEIIIEENPGAGWEVIGQEGFTNVSPNANIIKVDQNNIPYLAFHSYGGPLNVMSFENDSWTTIGSGIGTPDSDMDFELDSNGTPYVAFNDNSSGNKCVVKMYDGSDWVSVGVPVSSGAARSIELAIDNNGIPYVAFYEQEQNAAGYIYRFENGTWNMLGDGQIDPDAALFFELDFDSNNSPYLLWCTAPTNYSFYSRVSKFENDEWNLLGGGNISSEITYYHNNICIDANDQISVSICESTSTVYKIFTLEGSSWQNISPVDPLYGETHDLVADSEGNMYFGFQNAGQGSQTSVIMYDGNTWEPVGPVVISGVASKHQMDIGINNEPYIAYSDEAFGEKATVKAYLQSESAVANISLASIEFPETEIDQTAEESISITNTGTAILEIFNINTNNYIFSANLSEITIAPGATEELLISFNPEAEELYEGILSLESNDPYQTLINIDLSGQGRLIDQVQNLNNQLIQVYPNPTDDILYIQTSLNWMEAQLFNLKGQLLISEKVFNSSIDLNLASLDSGIYLLQIISSDKAFKKKIIIK